MFIYQGAKREPGVGVKEKGMGGSREDFPTVYMLISNLTALVLELFIHRMQINFSPFCNRLFFSFLTNTWPLMEKCKLMSVWKLWWQIIQLDFSNRLHFVDMMQFVAPRATESHFQFWLQQVSKCCNDLAGGFAFPCGVRHGEHWRQRDHTGWALVKKQNKTKLCTVTKFLFGAMWQ